MRRLSTRWKIFAAFMVFFLAIFIVVHTFMASLLLNYVNHVLNNIKGYQGSVESINIDLYRSAYRINKIVLNKKEGGIPTPFIAIEKVDLSLQWASLLHGRIVSDVELTRPVINFAVNKSAAQDGAGVDWTKPIKDLMPIDINHVRFKDGNIAYKDFSSTPQVNVFINHLDGEISNLRNIVDPYRPLPSSIAIEGSSIGNGDVHMRGRMNILKDVPDMDIYLALENVDLPALNNYSEAYAAFDFKSGSFDLYSQFNVKNGRVGGYIKPIATHLSVDVLKSANPVEIFWDSAVAAILKIFTNPTQDQFATQVALEGDLKNVGADPWSILGGIIRNAFIKAMSKGFNPTTQPQLAQPPSQ